MGREELFVVTKLPMFAMQPRDVLPFFEKSRKALGLDYVDLYLIHSPVGVRRDEERDEMKLNNGKVRKRFFLSCACRFSGFFYLWRSRQVIKR